MHGTIVSVEGAAIVLKLDDGGPPTKVSVTEGAVITLNGDPVALANLKAGDKVSLNSDPASRVEASRP